MRSLAWVILLAGCPSSDPAAPLTSDATTETSVGETSADDAPLDAHETSPVDGGNCPATMPNYGDSCSFTGICQYPDPTVVPDNPQCVFRFGCSAESGAHHGGTLAFAAGCPMTAPSDDASCTCGNHLWGESSGGTCKYPCEGGEIVARCTGKLSARFPGEVKWKVSACAPVVDAGGD